MNVDLNMLAEYMNENNADIKKLCSIRDRFENQFNDIYITFDYNYQNGAFIQIKMTLKRNHRVCIDRYLSYAAFELLASCGVEYLLDEMRTELLRSIYEY